MTWSGDNWCGSPCRGATNGVDLKSNVMFVHRFTHLSTDHIVMSWETPIGTLNRRIALIPMKNQSPSERRRRLHTSVSTASSPLSPGDGVLPTGGVLISPESVNLRVCEVLLMALSSRARSTRASVFPARHDVVGSGRAGRCEPAEQCGRWPDG